MNIYNRYGEIIFWTLLINSFLMNNFYATFALNNFPPRFINNQSSGAEIVVRVKEGPSSLNKEIYRLYGEDPDGDSLIFGALGPIASDILKIKNEPPNQAIVYLKKELDRETRDSYSLVLTLTDGKLGKGNFITKSMLIIVEDINDNEPLFRPFRTSISLSEDAKPGIVETIEAFDQDEGRFGQVLYQLEELEQETDGTQTFNIETNEGKGVISLVGKLDFERKSLYQLKILAIDRAMEGDRRTATATLLVRVDDVEDQPPIFTFVPALTKISEDSQIGKEVLRVAAIDGDRGINNPIMYSITKGPRDMFSINSSTGIVTVQGMLDREILIHEGTGSAAYILEIQATEVTATIFPPPNVLTEVTIILTDVNDERPRFRSDKYVCEVIENAHIDMPVNIIESNANGAAEVYDYDQGSNGTFNLYLRGEYSQFFEINPKIGVNEASFTIKVKNSVTLDYEKVKSIRFEAIAEERATDLSDDLSENAKSSTAEIIIHLKDVNDNFPEFEKDIYKASVPENVEQDAIIATFKAYDIDSGIFGTDGIRYTDVQGEISSMLSLDSVTGVLKMKTSNHGFDRETLSRYYLTIEARDNNGTGNRNTVQLLLTIEDVNDNKPTFLVERFQARVYENDEDFQSELIIKAIDLDQKDTPNSRIHYSIVDGRFKDNFSIDPSSGKMSIISPLDYEAIDDIISEAKNITLTVRATDSGLPALWQDCEVVITIYDRNDNSPVFEKQFYNKAIPEDTRDGSMVLQVNANDGDKSLTNSRIFYRISSGAQDKFVIEPDTGVLSVSTGANLDPDRMNPKQSFYTIYVTALDGNFGGFQRESRVIVNVTIVDVNNKSPEFIDINSVNVSEDAPNGFFVTRVEAKDLDTKPILRYSLDYSKSEAKNEFGTLIENSFFKDAFSINSVDGTIRVSKKLDRELWDHLRLALIVEDLAAVTMGQRATTMLNIFITDVNDNAPVFPKTVYRASVAENVLVGTSIIFLSADDKDLNKTLKYSLEGKSDLLSLIEIDERSGEVRVQGKIDRELYSWINLTVKAADMSNNPLYGLTSLNIKILDENDNNPVFLNEQIKEFTVSEDAPVGSLVAKVEASDDDTGDYGKVSYLLDSISSEGKFKIDRETGSIVIAEKLDREVTSSYNLLIQAVDNYEYGYITGESRKTFKQITIRVLDVNDETPRIEEKAECAFINEFHSIGDLVTLVSAKDLDDRNTPNGKLKFTIIDGNSKNLFAIENTQMATEKVINGQLNEINNEAFFARIITTSSVRGKVTNYTLIVKCEDYGTPVRSSTAKVHICINRIDPMINDIYLLKKDQRVRFVLRLSPYELREKLEKFIDVLGNITGAIVNVDGYKFHTNDDGSVDKKKTDLYLHFVHPKENSTMEVNNVLALIDKNIDYLDELYKEFNVLITEPSESHEELLTIDDQLKIALMGSTAFLLLILILITCLYFNQRARYERKLKAATVTAFNNRDQHLNRADVPNTNMHADEGSNPIWMTGYDNEWFKDDEQISHNSNGNNSLDENVVGDVPNGPLTPTDSLNGSGRVSGSDTSINDRQALCRGVTAGRLTPQNITLPSSPKGKATNNNNNNNNKNNNNNHSHSHTHHHPHHAHSKKPCAPKPPVISPQTHQQSNKNMNIIHTQQTQPSCQNLKSNNTFHPPLNKNKNNQVTCKNSINTVYISSNINEATPYHQVSNNLSVLNLETTEL